MSVKKENEEYKVEASVGKGCRCIASILVKNPQVRKDYKHAIKEINKEVSLPGFRKGKAPDDAIIKQYSTQIEREWKEILVNNAFKALIKLTEIYPYNKETIDKPKIERCSIDSDAVVTITYECYPEVPEVKFQEIALPKLKKKEVSKEEVDEILKEVRQAHATWEEISGKTVAEGDYVDLTIEKIDVEPAQTLVQKRRFEVSPVMVAWLKEMVLGKKSGDVQEKKVNLSENEQEMMVRVTVHSVQKILLPEVDDTLAQKIGANDLEDMTTKIRANIDRDHEAKLKEEKLRKLEDLLLEKYNFEVPASLLNREIESRTKEKVDEFRKQNMSADQIEKEKDNIATWARDIGEKSLRLHFLLSQIGERGNVQLSREELNEKLNNEILRNPYYHNLVKENNEALQNLIRRLTTHFQNEKIREYALSQVESSR